MRRTPLHDGWTLRAAGGSVPPEQSGRVVPATVPGCVHTDLLAAGLIPDPYLDDNEAKLAWIGRTDWRYETTFDWTPSGPNTDLVCEGLDTVAHIELNGVEIARTRNMHRSFRFALAPALREGTNHLAVTFTSALDHAEAVRAEVGERPHTNRFPFNMIRKMACNFGWDWGPELVTAGIWRPIALEEWHTARFSSVRPLATMDGTTGRVAVHAELRRDGEGPVVVKARVGERETTVVLDGDSSTAVLRLGIDEPELWWPRGYGSPARHDLAVTLSTMDGTVLDEWSGRIGFRTVELDTTKDEHGTRFTFVINGVPVFAKGVNWIPDDCFPHRVDRDRYARRLTQAVDAGVNLVRVWGGGIYESEDFYDLADEMGLLVWQDFLFACADYPEEEPLRREVIAEAREAVTRLSGRASLVLWNGSNENAWLHEARGWNDLIGDATWGIGYYTEVLPAIVDELDGTRPYIPSSPWSFSDDILPNDPDHGCAHIWDVWNLRDYTAYRDYIPRFASEFGFCGAPALTTLRRALPGEELSESSPGVVGHYKANAGMEGLDRRLAEHFPPPAGFEDWHWATQLAQARAVALGVRHFRSHTPRCAGTIVWQLNDCWPVISWSVVDGDGRLKPAWYALRDSYAERLMTIQPRAGRPAVVLVNDTGDPWETRVEVRRAAFDGAELARAELTATVDARGASTLELPGELVTPGDPTAELLVATSAGAPVSTWFFAEDLEQKLPVAEYSVNADEVPSGYRVTVTAETLLRDLTLAADLVAEDAVADQALLTVLPGETATFTVRAPARLDPRAFTSALRTANQLGGKR
ncbi:glycoside hydrolase family 2 protein [Amycolatopsis pigmentata]|uniref:beta-mannosidase n=1 Tax=Amycolatopsis pigmentata TaxID=450801 RepID=A0ABW5FYX9_9PSEU